MNKRIKPVLLLILLISTVCLAGCGNKEAGSGKGIVNVSAIRVERGVLNSDSIMTGKIEAVQTANIVSKVPGKVANVNVDMGSVVKVGQVLINLDANDLAANIKVARAAVDNAQITYKLAGQNYERGKALLVNPAISQADFENNFEGQYLKAEAALRSAQATLEKAEIAYNDTFIKAPFSGVITARNINPGELAGTQTPVIAMVNLDKVVVKGSVNEAQINKLVSDQAVGVKISSISSDLFTGTIVNISPAADLQTKAYPVKVQIDNANHLLKPGMFAEVTISDNKASGLLIPKEAIRTDKDKKLVFTVENQVAKMKVIEAGIADDKNVMISSGLNEGEMVVVTGSNLLKDGQTVKVQANNQNRK